MKKERELEGDLANRVKPILAVSVDLFQEKINRQRSANGI